MRVLKAGNMSNEAIAEVFGVSEPTLTRHFSLDLEIGAAKVTAEILMAQYRSAMGGNVSAQNKMLEQVGAVRARDKRAPAAPKLGKKEQQALAAKNIGGKFAPPSPPKLVVSND
ncbi:hypothetical protein OIU34_26675 [Pararhizobium sp. BT-229]|uniref:hypothetical protein n=1 Tax=Pararhizobium sp. BT-229 TaxID=2986923 RepID=UPI0021F6DE0A|nr:hypothetical protein [Pararhizobium sp. BT-229]MCV9965468.1 hypothetical protein [Pararhizobium sp. BT-229]